MEVTKPDGKLVQALSMPGELREWLPTVEMLLAFGACLLWYTQGGAIWYQSAWPGPLPLGLLAAMWALRLTRNGFRLRVTALAWPLAFFVVSTAIGVGIAYSTERALAKFWLIIGAVGLYQAVAGQYDTRRLYVALVFWLLISVSLAAYFAVTTTWHPDPRDVARLGNLVRWLTSIGSDSINPNVAGGLLILLLPLYLPLYRMSSELSVSSGLRTSLRGSVMLAGAIALMGLILSGSFGAWIAAVFGGSLWLIWRRSRRESQARTLAFLSGVVLASGLLAFAVVQMGRGAVPAEGPLDLELVRAVSDTVANRLQFVEWGMLLAQDAPYTGFGLGMVQMPLAVYTLLIHVGYVPHMHNIFVDLAIEQGLFGVITYSTLIVTAWVWGIRRLRHAEPLSELLIEAALVSITATLVHGLIDDALYGSRALVFLFVPFGFLVAGGQRVGQAGTFRRPSVRWVHIAAGLFIFSLLISVMLVGGHPVGAWYAGWGAVEQARVELNLYDPLHFDDPNLDEVRRRADLRKAIRRFHLALDHDPMNRTARQRLTEIWLARGQYEAALEMIEPLWRIGDRDRVTRLLYGDTLVATGRVSEAVAVVDGLQFARDRLLGQAWSRYHLQGDVEREAYARQAAAALAP